MTVAVVAIGTRGTLGHATSASGIADCISHGPCLDVRLLVDSGIKPYVGGFAPTSVVHAPVVSAPSVGGAAQRGYAAQLIQFHERYRPSAYVFDTFYDLAFLDWLASEGVPRVLISYRYRVAARKEFEAQARSRFCRIYWYAEPYELVRTAGPSKFSKDELVGPPLLSIPRRVAKARPKAGSRSVLLTCGGGGRPGSRWAYAKMLSELAELPGVDTIEVPGPFFEEGSMAPTMTRTRLLELMQSSDLVVCEAGYFTTLEAACVAKRALLVPGLRRIDNQELRAARMAEGVGISSVLPANLDRSFRRSVCDLLESEAKISPLPDWSPTSAMDFILEGIPLVSKS